MGLLSEHPCLFQLVCPPRVEEQRASPGPAKTVRTDSQRPGKILGPIDQVLVLANDSARQRFILYTV